MQKHPSILLLLALVLLSGCIERYYPDEEELTSGTMVVVAHLNDLPGEQSVYLSRSSTLLYPEYDPLTGCYVELIALDGSTREFSESQPGEYSGYLDGEFLYAGGEYYLVIITPDGKRYESAFEKLHPAPEIEAIYFEREDHPKAALTEVEEGIQFYVDFEISKDSGPYLRWQLIETYEIYTNDNEAQIFDEDRVLKDLPDSSSWRNCWITTEVPEIHTLDLTYVEGTLYKRLPLNFVNNETRRLYIRYSLQVRQMALSNEAFWYWNELGKNLQSMGKLYDTQPSITPSNICNVDDENELVIGYFSVSGASEKRIFVENVPDLKFYKDLKYCAPGEWPRFLRWFRSEYLPVYLTKGYVDGFIKSGEVNKECVDCRAYKGSSHIMPEFW